MEYMIFVWVIGSMIGFGVTASERSRMTPPLY